MSDIEPTRDTEPTEEIEPIRDIDADIEVAYNYIMSALYKKYSNKYNVATLRLYVLQYIANRVCNKTAIELKKKITTKKNIERAIDIIKNINKG